MVSTAVRTRSTIRISVLTLLLIPARMYAQAGSTPVHDAQRTRPIAIATARSGPVTVDGRLDETAWALATPVGGFTQQKPNEGAPATEKTEVRFLYDEDAVYIGARMYDSHGARGVTTMLVRRDQPPQSDVLRVDFDPYHDRIHSVEFDVNPSSWRGDATDTDRSWDPVWEAAARVDSVGWTAEIRIPFSQLRFSRDSVQTWGLNLTRLINRNQERDMWSFWRQNEAGGPAFFGELGGLRIHGSRHAELLPYVVARTKRLSSGNPLSPFYNKSPSDFRVGADMKYLATSSFTLAATVNPDFGQVEVDPAVVNLSAYEVFFPEQRPFFVEGADAFRFGSPGCNINCGLGLNLFYSRRIGRAPQGAGLAYSAGQFADVPENTAILGATKLTGRTKNGYTVGFLDAVTQRATAEVAAADGTRLFQPIEPLTNTLVTRAKREMKGGNLVLGGILTSVNRRLDDPGLASLLLSSAQSVGADAEYFWGSHTYRLYTAVTASRAAGDSLAIGRVQRSSARYFQRPDRGILGDGIFSAKYDLSATSLDGYGGIARFVKQGGKWQGDLNAAVVSPGFETNDLGFLQIADWRWVNGTFGPQFTTPTRFYRNLQMLVGGEQQWNYDGDVTGRDLSAFASAQFLNYWSGTIFASHGFTALSDRLTRGGPVVEQPGNTQAFVGLSSDPRRRVILNANLSSGVQDDGGNTQSLRLSATVQPASNLRLSIGPGFSRSASTDQYVTQFPDRAATAFYGRRYVFAHVDQRQLYMSTRASATFTPALSLDLFAQPLIASADYHDFEEFAAPRRRQKLIYGRDVGSIQATGTGATAGYFIDPDGLGPAAGFNLRNPNFNFRSLRGTGVLRWEWRPGSTAYLVWTQTRSASEAVGDLVFSRDRSALFAAPADNIFVLKVSYWLGI